jgi:hypothetical protein
MHTTNDDAFKLSATITRDTTTSAVTVACEYVTMTIDYDQRTTTLRYVEDMSAAEATEIGAAMHDAYHALCVMTTVFENASEDETKAFEFNC